MGAVVLYAVTAALEAPVILARYVAIYVVAAIALKATGSPSSAAAEWAKLALAPALWSAVALVNPAGGSWWWQQKLGGRRPSLREYATYREALQALQAATTISLPQPKRWFVIDESAPDAAVCGDALMLTRGLLESPQLKPALAHQLGHLRGMDARLTAALHRLVLGGEARPRARANAQATWKPTRWATRMTVTLLRGGLALRLTSISWGEVWREAEYEADRFAAAIGCAEELADFLEVELLKHDHPIPLVGLSDHTHPPTELRIGALRALAREQRPTSAHTASGALGHDLRIEESGV